MSRSIARPLIKFFGLFILLPANFAQAADPLDCGPGEQVNTSMGDGVIMRTCLWESEPGKYIRIGPLELTKHGILILKLQTNDSGQLHGRYTSWSDAGEITESGMYHEGKKQGPWLKVDENGKRETLIYDSGNPLDP